jgi:hypothetical protein
MCLAHVISVEHGLAAKAVAWLAAPAAASILMGTSASDKCSEQACSGMCAVPGDAATPALKPAFCI